MIRWLLYRFIPFYLLLTALIAGLMLLFSETGLNWLWLQAKPYLPAGLQIERVQGRLLGQIQIHGLHIDNPQMQLDIEQAWLEWSPWALFDARLRVNNVYVIGLRYQAGTSPDKAPTPSSKPAHLPNLPDVELQNLILRDIEISAPDKSLFLLNEAVLSGALLNNKLELELKKFDTRELGRWQAKLQGQLTPEEFQLHAFTLDSADAPELQLSVAGQCQWPQLDCQVSADWTQLRWPLATTQWRSPRGSLQLQRKQTSLDAQLAAELHGEQLPDSTLQLSAVLPTSSQNLSLKGQWKANSNSINKPAPALQLQGQYHLDNTKLQAKLGFKQLDASWFWSQWPSQLNGQANISGQLQPSLQLRSEAITLQGQLREQPIDAQLAGEWRDLQHWVLEKSRVQWGDNQLHAQLSHRSTWNGSLQLTAPQLEQIDAKLDGELKADISLSGKQRWPSVDWKISGSRLQWADWEVDSLNSTGRYSDKLVQQQLSLKDVYGQGLMLESLSLQSQGSPRQATHELTLDETRGYAQISASSQWLEASGKLMLSLDQGQLKLGKKPRDPQFDWVLQQAAQISWHKQQLKLQQHCWRSQEIRSCLHGDWQDDKVSAGFELQAYPLDRLQALLPTGTQINGDVSLNLALQPSPIKQPQIQLSLKNSPIQVQMPQNKELIEVLGILPGELSGEFKDNEGEARWSFPVAGNPPQQAGLHGYAQIKADKTVQGQLDLALNDLAIVSALSSEVLQSSGQLQGQLRLSGTQAQAALAGELKIVDAQLDLDRPNLQLQHINLSLQADGNKALKLSGAMQSGDGDLQLDGQWHWQDQTSRLQAQVKGQNFLAVDTAEAHVLVSPDLRLEADLPNIQINGRIDIPQAMIQPRELNQASSAITPVADQRIVGQEKSLENALRINSEITLVLGDNVAFEGLGLSTELGGRLLTRMKAGRVATGVGDLRLINGHYKAYGQDLTIERGRLIFSGGPLSEPGLDIKAYRQANDDVRAGVIVRGPLKQPELKLYSDPDMRETDQLSYLVLGRAAESQSEGDQAALNNAALALGLKGGDFLAKRFKGKLGLDEVTIGSRPGEDSSQASLVLGKYLSPDIYISYGIGLFKPVYTFKLRYQLSSKWTLQTESGVESGGDLFYTIER